MKSCYRCGTPWESFTKKQPGVKETCTKCNAYLHCCMNCRWYLPGKPNDCLIPNTDKVANREGPNFCDFFEIKDRVENLDSSWEQQKEKAKKDFEQLFGTP
ncbi:MAG TPA: hypothetical protein PLT82_01305 [Candidatus Hydrogenedens sp.]|nr:hypothetical protein [Candidatus Hydrogenedens sp.]HOK08582.1 hypothetical protein [Candidatus Hydrogenedens sp.]HOL19070.1 hypothetical protein [Candidatus Hydrogenedens sp.]HPP57748.1 hypothetical protein [Candidatus Hydrogenedens sp.]